MHCNYSFIIFYRFTRLVFLYLIVIEKMYIYICGLPEKN